MNFSCRIGVALVLAFILSSPSFATTLSFSCITFNSPADCSIGESQLQVDITDAGVIGGVNSVDFTFTNIGSDQSTISEVYFDDGTLLGISTITSSSGVSFSQGATPPDLPGGNEVGFDVTASFLADADNPAPRNGVNADPNDWVTITFALINGKTYADTIAALGTDLRIGLHVINFQSGGSESFVAPTAVPIPAGIWLFASAVIGMMGIKRKS